MMIESRRLVERLRRPAVVFAAVAMSLGSLVSRYTLAADEHADAKIDAALLAELKALDKKLEKVEDLRAAITQRKHVSLLKEPLVSTGSVLVKGERTRWDITKPTPSTTLTSSSEIRIHYPRQKLVEVYRVDERLASAIASPLPRLALLLKHFRIERLPTPKDADAAKHLAIRLTPLNDEMKKHIARVEVLIDRASAVTRRMELVDVDGDRTVIDFSAIEVSPGLKAKDFELALPPGTRVVHPLEAEQDSSS